MKKLEHKNVIGLHEVINDPEEDKLFLSNQKFNLKIYLIASSFGLC